MVECFPTLVTLKPFLTVVSYLMPVQVGLLVKSLRTHFALIGLLACVRSLVYSEMGLAVKCFPAFFTRVRFITRVAPLMDSEG